MKDPFVINDTKIVFSVMRLHVDLWGLLWVRMENVFEQNAYENYDRLSLYGIALTDNYDKHYDIGQGIISLRGVSHEEGSWLHDNIHIGNIDYIKYRRGIFPTHRPILEITKSLEDWWSIEIRVDQSDHEYVMACNRCLINFREKKLYNANKKFI